MKVHHFGYLVKDMDEAVAQLKSLGFEIEVDRFYVKERKQWNIFLKNEATRIELIQPDQNHDDAQKANPGNIAANLPAGVGVYHTCFESYDFDQDIKDMRENGFMPISRVENEDSYDGARMQFLFSNKVGIVEVIEIFK